MPTRSASRNGHSDDSATTTRRSNGRSHDIISETNRHIIRPAKRAVKSMTRDLPGWVPWAAGALVASTLIYSLFQIESVRSFFGEMFEPSDEGFDDSLQGNSFARRDYEDESDYGSGDFGSSASERLRSRL